MNSFYRYPRILQWSVAILLLICFFILLAYWLDLLERGLLWYFVILPFAPVMQFCLTPFLTLIGLYRYLSPMLLVSAPSPQKYDLHNGTSFDYLFVMRGIAKGRPTRQQILAYYLQGLLKIVEELEQGLIPKDITISGTSYFFSESTARRLGFTIEKPSWFLKINQYFNYIDLFWMYSRAHGKWTLPNLRNVKAATIQGERLMAQKEQLERLHSYLQNR